MQTLTLILPTIDEADNLASLVPEVLALGVQEVLVVDDGSTDGTRELVERFAREDRRVRLIARSGRRSLTASLQDGIDQANGELVGWMDADDTMPAEDLPRLVSAIRAGADVAIGSRFAPGGGLKGQLDDGSLGRLRSLFSMHRTADGALGAVLSLGLNAAILPLLLGRFGLHDWTSGFLVARRAAIAPIRLRGDHGEYFFDLWLRAEARGLRVVEIGSRMRPRATGVSKTGVRLSQYLRRGLRYLGAAVAARFGSSGTAPADQGAGATQGQQ